MAKTTRPRETTTTTINRRAFPDTKFMIFPAIAVTPILSLSTHISAHVIVCLASFVIAQLSCTSVQLNLYNYISS